MEEWGGGEGNVASQHKLGQHRQEWEELSPMGTACLGSRLHSTGCGNQAQAPTEPVPGERGQVSTQPHSSPSKLSSKVN